MAVGSRNEGALPSEDCSCCGSGVAGGGGPRALLAARLPVCPVSAQGSPAVSEVLQAEPPPQKQCPALSALLEARSQNVEFYKPNKVF